MGIAADSAVGRETAWRASEWRRPGVQRTGDAQKGSPELDVLADFSSKAGHRRGDGLATFEEQRLQLVVCQLHRAAGEG